MLHRDDNYFSGEQAMLRADTKCIHCKQLIVVGVDETGQPSTDVRFRYDCPLCGERVDEALAVFDPVDHIPQSFALAWRSPVQPAGY
jgi:hypothetical protein